jgi:hypothetical protein
MSKPILAAAVLSAIFWLGLPSAQSTTLARMDLHDLTTRATYVARVRAVSIASQVEAGSVSTFTTFEVLETWKGNPPPKFTLRLPGGEAAGLRVNVEGAPRFARGEEAVLFLETQRSGQMSIVSWAQGTFRIRASPGIGAPEAIQDTAGLQLLNRDSAQLSPGGRRWLPLALLRAQVARALAESHRERQQQ